MRRFLFVLWAGLVLAAAVRAENVVLVAGGGDVAIAQDRSPVDPLFHDRELPRHFRPEPLRVLPGSIHRGRNLLAGRSHP